MNYGMFIDDEREPGKSLLEMDLAWVIARSSAGAISTMESMGCPSFISFDHDLGGDDTAMKVVNWMINEDLMQGRELGISFIEPGFAFCVHSQNPIGADNIQKLLQSYLNFRRIYGFN